MASYLVAVQSARRGLARGLGVMIVVAIAAGLAFAHSSGVALRRVQTGSMAPTFVAGDAVIVRRVEPSQQLTVGDIISFRSSVDRRLILSHRVVSIQGERLVTQGDANQRHDLAIDRRQVIGLVAARAPGLGRWLDRLQTPIGLALAVYLPAVLILADQLRRLASVYRPAHYRLYGRRTVL
ncbi:MAG: signal peptidase I [Candidatus Saccharimonadales bacterium]